MFSCQKLVPGRKVVLMGTVAHFGPLLPMRFFQPHHASYLQGLLAFVLSNKVLPMPLHALRRAARSGLAWAGSRAYRSGRTHRWLTSERMSPLAVASVEFFVYRTLHAPERLAPTYRDAIDVLRALHLSHGEEVEGLHEMGGMPLLSALVTETSTWALRVPEPGTKAQEAWRRELAPQDAWLTEVDRYLASRAAVRQLLPLMLMPPLPEGHPVASPALVRRLLDRHPHLGQDRDVAGAAVRVATIFADRDLTTYLARTSGAPALRAFLARRPCRYTPDLVQLALEEGRPSLPKLSPRDFEFALSAPSDRLRRAAMRHLRAVPSYPRPN